MFFSSRGVKSMSTQGGDTAQVIDFAQTWIDVQTWIEAQTSIDVGFERSW